MKTGLMNLSRRTKIFRFFVRSFVLIFIPVLVFGHEWKEHKYEIRQLESQIIKLEQELEIMVERKKNTRQASQIEQTLQRIVEIHSELITLRKTMDTTRDHLKLDHPDKVAFLNEFDSRMKNAKKKKVTKKTPLSRRLDDLLIKIQLKYAGFAKIEEKEEEKKEEVAVVEKVIEVKKKEKKEREAKDYLQRRMPVKLSK